MNNNKKTDLQLTKLTGNDIATHEDLYIAELLIGGFHIPSYRWTRLYYDYAIIELQKANDLFLKTFS